MSNDNTLLITGANVWCDDSFRLCDVVVSNGMIVETAEKIDADKYPGCKVIDATGKYLVPGLVDMHVHFREPGYSYKETIKDGSAAAAAGGFTTVCTMPNLNPAPDSPDNLRRQLDIINRDAIVNVIPYATITRKRMGHELVDYATLAPYVAGFSDDGTGVQDEEVMRAAMKGIAPTGKILAAHCEVEALLNRGYIHDGEYARAHGHRGICSESEWKEIERDIILAEETHCRLHVCHISTKESVELIRRAKERGVLVTCETGPHYLTFCDEDLQEEGRFKMNPPIRSRADRDALRQGIIDGTIDAIATDHAPHSAEEKGKGLEKSAMGVVGLETAFAAVYTTMVKTGLISMERLVEIMSVNPRKILGLPCSDGIKAGNPADITILDTETEQIVDPATFRTKGRATPYAGMLLQGSIAALLYKGVQVL
ncbi:dihydroorotase [Lepagella muris]|uniref:Dihydroorotase n=1 Tax=Lepagella muris TaxID=3032870 RepID=A0AC61RBC2_9BACT|nr:dihydroorotase [Lepagella muris]ROT03886.1 dihydroorotase [Muribaculaceae bacterium Isolate-037 (Harlan)]TGY75645.1 dihydroorotase [Lepagella muris]THG45999.1 dihydroorotase [Bacteroidales bacterium]TKC58891.1 dihydroorotase [Bacteroidales bacterium]